ncbi:MAG: amino acid adenylation domain-containing protein [Daejeonella sp.]|uniref:amino acid adenylation domain-containing protein n=1 Tax=Daejeonella sp. TaxID=2805397 RepID=UPI003C75E3F4
MKLVSPEKQSEIFKGPLPDQHIAYWKAKLQGISPIKLNEIIVPSGPSFGKLTFPHDQEETFSFSISREAGEQLNILNSNHRTSLTTTLLAVFKIMLYRFTNQSDLCIGTHLSRTVSMDGIVGYSSNTLALKSHLDGEMLFSDFLTQIELTITEALNHQPVNLNDILGADAGQGTSNFNPLDIRFSAEHESGLINPAPLSLKSPSEDFTAGSDLNFKILISPEGLQGEITYRTSLYDKQGIEKMVKYYINLLDSASVSAQQKIGAIAMIPEDEILFFENFNDTITNYSDQKTIVDLFEEQVVKTPEATALIRLENSLSYRNLNERANKLARYLVSQGVKPGSNIGLLAGRDFDMIIGMYAIMKTGSAYIPIDPEYPADRQKYILNQSSASYVITDADYPEADLFSDLKVIKLNKADLEHFDSGNLNIQVPSNQLAYTIYTSGSTGVPKGVMIEHHSAVNLIEWVNKTFNINTNDRVLFITSMCFDLSVYDIFGLLSAGGAVVIASQQEVIDIEKLKKFLVEYKITFWDSVPTTMNYLVKELKSGKEDFVLNSLRLVFLSGDWIPIQLPREIKSHFPNARVISLGGATEGTVWSNFYEVEKLDTSWKSIPYGKPIANNFFYVLNEQLSPVPVGVMGDLFIGGVGVAKGYANDPVKTHHSFLEDPFNSKAGGRMYRTGDLGRMMPDGNLEFLGRKDSQIKIRGFRVELGEIENVLNKSSLVNQAVVTARTDADGNKNLIAFIVPNGESFDRKEILAYLKSKLPEYMIPSIFEELKEFPLTSNGKIDKKALLNLEITETGAKYAPPRTEQQLKLVEIWQEILGVERVGIHDNFFELGGHSLMAVRMITKLEAEIGIRFPLSILFKYPTINSLLSSNEVRPSNLENQWKSLVAIKDSGSKIPIYIIHGSGLNVLNFSSIAKFVDPEQPVFGLQAKGLSGLEDPLDDMNEIASSYIKEILEHNPSGPYAIAGYSFGGYVAVEMRNQLEAMGKEVKMLAIFDTNAVDSEKYRKWPNNLWNKIKNQGPKFLWIMESLFSKPATTIKYQSFLLNRAVKTAVSKLTGIKTMDPNTFYTRLDKITEKHLYAFQNYTLRPFNDTVHLFRAKERIYFVNDFHYLGWRKYAQKGVKIYEVPGDHKTMLLDPHAREFARALQYALDNC